MKTTFIANMSHEIRTPLGAIMGFSELMADTERPPEERQKFLEIIRRNGEHLHTVIDDILDISKIEAGALRIEKILFSPAAMLDDILRLLEVKVRDKGLTLKGSIDSSVPPMALSDPHRLKQILMNIIDNAIKFTDLGEVSVKVWSENQGSHRQRLFFEVRDTGEGLTLEQASRLFKAFSQGDDSVTRKHGGTGLGLTLSRKLAQILGGDVQLMKSEPQRGSTFLVTIETEVAD
jgi:signal transduction histidine kinase